MWSRNPVRSCYQRRTWTSAASNLVGKAERAKETNGEGTYFQEGHHVRIKRTQEIGRAHIVDGSVVYVLMVKTNEAKYSSARVGEDACDRTSSHHPIQSRLHEAMEKVIAMTYWINCFTSNRVCPS